MKRMEQIGALVVALLLASAMIYGYASGPDPRYTGAPGDSDQACASLGCHIGTALNGGGGSVVVNFPNGATYSPGVQQTFSIVINDPSARVYGFQMTARLESNLAGGQAGDFSANPDQQYVICDNSTFKGANGCPGNAPVQFIEHNRPYNTNTISVLWKAPATNVGNIRVYVAANAANGDANNTGDHIYTASYTLTPQGAVSPPTVASVVSASAFNANAGLASGTWLEIYGSNLSSTTRSWAGSDFNGNNAPTSLDGVRVSIGGVPAFVDFVSPGQVNVQAPDDAKTGAGFEIVLTNAAGSSNAVAMQKKAIAPALLAPPSFNVQGRQWVVAIFPDLTFAGKPGLISGLNFRIPKPGDVLTVFGIGFGPVTPPIPPGVIATVPTTLQSQPSIRFGEVPATLAYYGLSPSFVGLYQFNVIVPTVAPGDMPFNVDIAGASLNQNLFITVGQ